MKKLIFALGGAVMLISGCSGKTIVYEGKRQPISQVEEKLDNKLERENPKMDLDVNISEDTDSKKKKKKYKKRK